MQKEWTGFSGVGDSHFVELQRAVDQTDGVGLRHSHILYSFNVILSSQRQAATQGHQVDLVPFGAF
jgi:hypothetical protein